MNLRSVGTIFTGISLSALACEARVWEGEHWEAETDLQGSNTGGGDCDDDPTLEAKEPPSPPEAGLPVCPAEDESIYVMRDVSCGGVTFACPDGYSPFDGACGCGCSSAELPPEASCPAEDTPGRWVLSSSPSICIGLELSCPSGSTVFSDNCGCGCLEPGVAEPSPDPEPEAPACPDPQDEAVQYLNQDPTTCDKIQFTCPAGCVTFSGACGCGCIEPTP